MDAAERFRRSYFRRHRGRPPRAATPHRQWCSVYRRDLPFDERRFLSVVEPMLMTRGEHLRVARWLEALANLHRVYALVSEKNP